jgi:siderophore synthetase component
MTSWDTASAALLAKLVAELSFEGALSPRPMFAGGWRAQAGPAGYEFAGLAGRMGDWRVRPGSVTRNGEPTDPFAFLLDLHAAADLDPAATALTIRELQATLAADTHLLDTALPVAELAELSCIELEGYQTGHPWIVANKGRIGFSAADTARYAPESRQVVRLTWLAVHESLASHHEARIGVPFAVPDGFVAVPVHPWQLDAIVQPMFASELAAGRVRVLGEGPDEYRPQQSIRTFTNVSRPDQPDVTVSLSIRDTMACRGIPAELARAVPAASAWIQSIRGSDEVLSRVILPGEVAGVAVPHPLFDSVPGVPYRYRQLLGALWREPVTSFLDPGERARTLAALLHVDADGRSFAAELVRRSGLAGEQWLARLFGAILPPLLHLLYRYGLAFNPHCENAIVVYAGDVPVRLAVRDFADDLKLLDSGLPEYVGAPSHLLRFPAAELSGSILTSLFVGHFRYLAPLCAEHLGVPEDRFWDLVRAEITGYQHRFPDLADRFALFGLLAPWFERVCLNRERLLPGRCHDRSTRDASFAFAADPVPNPVYR